MHRCFGGNDFSEAAEVNSCWASNRLRATVSDVTRFGGNALWKAAEVKQLLGK